MATPGKPKLAVAIFGGGGPKGPPKPETDEEGEGMEMGKGGGMSPEVSAALTEAGIPEDKQEAMCRAMRAICAEED